MTRTTVHAQARESLTRGLLTRDSILLPPSEAELQAWYEQTARMAALDPGRIYDGISRLLGSLSAENRDAVLKRLDAERELSEAEAVGQATAPSETKDSLRAMRDATAAFNRSLNEAARRRHGQSI